MEQTMPLTWLPVALALWVPFSYIVTYSLAVGNGHVSAWLPYISATGALAPESCWFSLFTNLSTFFLVLLGWLRQAALEARPPGGGGRWLPLVAGSAGLAACAGLFVAANWQVTTAPLAHFIGSQICFHATAAYFVLQTVVSAPISSLAVTVARVCVSVIILALALAGDFCSYRAFSQYKGASAVDPLHWSVDQPGGGWRLAGALLEWTLLLAVSLALLTLAPDFRSVRLQYPQIKMKRKWIEQS